MLEDGPQQVGRPLLGKNGRKRLTASGDEGCRGTLVQFVIQIVALVKWSVALGDVRPANVQLPRIAGFDRCIGAFDLLLPLPALVLDSSQFINAPQCRLVVGRGQFGTDAPDVDARAAGLQVGDGVLVQTIRGHHLRLREAPLVEQSAGGLGEFHQVAGIQSDTQ